MTFTLTALLPLLKLIAGPALIWVLRNLTPGFIAKFPAAFQPIGAAVVNVLIAIATGADPVNSLAMLVEAVKAFFMTGGIVKGIDLLSKKPYTITAEEKARLVSASNA